MNNSNPLLSFAIPTYNFGRFIGETILSIQNGLEILKSNDIEIVILDGGSTDNTAEVVGELARVYKNIVYVRNEQRGGIDQDLDAVSSMTSGKYIWLFSADDLLLPGWDLHITGALKDELDILLVPATLCTINMTKIRQNPIFNIQKSGAVVDLSTGSQDFSMVDYLRCANSLEALFSFMSAIIVRSNVWRNAQPRPDYFGTCWAHCVRLIPILINGPKLRYITTMLILKRGGNDSFMERGFVARISIAVDGWKKIIDDFFLCSVTQAMAYGLLRRDISIAMFLYGKVASRTAEESIKLRKMAHMLYFEMHPTVASRINYWIFYFSPFNSTLAPFINFILPQLISMRQKLKKLSS